MKKFQKFIRCMCVVTTLVNLSGCQNAVKKKKWREYDD